MGRPVRSTGRPGEGAEGSRRFTELLEVAAGPVGPVTGQLVGVEHEYQVWRGGRREDFRTVIHHLGLGQPSLHPTDPYAYRLGSGSSLTCDGYEAEIATPPEPVTAGFTGRVERGARADRGHLVGLIGPDRALRGYSAHCSVAVPRGLESDVARGWVDTFAPALMLLFGGRDTLGLAVRPRPGRVELCSSYVDGAWLRASLVFAVAGVRHLVGVVSDGRPPDATLPRLAVRVEPAVHRFGYYLDRGAFGVDLYGAGRAARLRRLDGGTVTAHDHLGAAWGAARSAVAADCSAEETALVDAMVGGSAELLVESAPTPSGPADGPIPSRCHAVHGRTGVIRRPTIELAPVVVSWDVTVFAARSPGRPRLGFACVPRPYLAAFYGTLDRGDLDSTIGAYLNGDPTGRVLADPGAAEHPGLYDALGPRHLLLTDEPPPAWDGSGPAPAVAV